MTRSLADTFADELVGAYTRAWASISAELDSIATDPARWRQRERLRALQRQVESSMRTLDQRSFEWLTGTYPRIYAMGAADSAGQFAWSEPHAAAIQALAQTTYDGLLAATALTNLTTKRLVRELSRKAVFDQLVQGKTAAQQTRALVKVLESKKVHAVVYRNGARHQLGDYADMLIRTQSGLAYNQAAVNAGIDVGAKFFEIFDGLDCGYRSHQDRDKANGKIVRARDVVLLSHPRCTRAIGARPDLSTAPKPVTPVEMPRVQRLSRPTPIERRAARRLVGSRR